MIKVCICDDDQRQNQYTDKLVSGYLSRYGAETDCFTSADALLKQVKGNDYFPDIAILDIKPDGLNGIELARQLNRLIPGCCIIFLTGSVEYCSDVYGTEHIFFMLKKQAAQYMSVALEKAIGKIDSRFADFVTVSARGTRIVLKLQKIIYIESVSRKLYVYTEEDCFETYAKLDELLTESQSRDFVRCHQSYLVNLRYLSGMNSTHFILTNGKAVPISRSRFLYSKEQFFKYMHLNMPALPDPELGEQMPDLKMADGRMGEI